MTVTIYDNPNCGTSRNVLAMVRQSVMVALHLVKPEPPFNSSVLAL
jgi:arsenate reductase-like glutaredoxin family protein